MALPRPRDRIGFDSPFDADGEAYSVPWFETVEPTFVNEGFGHRTYEVRLEAPTGSGELTVEASWRGGAWKVDRAILLWRDNGGNEQESDATEAIEKLSYHRNRVFLPTLTVLTAREG